jgi:hypothetical protein
MVAWAKSRVGMFLIEKFTALIGDLLFIFPKLNHMR